MKLVISVPPSEDGGVQVRTRDVPVMSEIFGVPGAEGTSVNKSKI